MNGLACDDWRGIAATANRSRRLRRRPVWQSKSKKQRQSGRDKARPTRLLKWGGSQAACLKALALWRVDEWWEAEQKGKGTLLGKSCLLAWRLSTVFPQRCLVLCCVIHTCHVLGSEMHQAWNSQRETAGGAIDSVVVGNVNCSVAVVVVVSNTNTTSSGPVICTIDAGWRLASTVVSHLLPTRRVSLSACLSACV